jgi:hypothetical protein
MRGTVNHEEMNESTTRFQAVMETALRLREQRKAAGEVVDIPVVEEQEQLSDGASS